MPTWSAIWRDGSAWPTTSCEPLALARSQQCHGRVQLLWPSPCALAAPTELRDLQTFVFIDAAAEDGDERQGRQGVPGDAQSWAAGGTSKSGPSTTAALPSSAPGPPRTTTSACPAPHAPADSGQFPSHQCPSPVFNKGSVRWEQGAVLWERGYSLINPTITSSFPCTLSHWDHEASPQLGTAWSRQCVPSHAVSPPRATQGHQLPACLHVAGIKQLWLAVSGPHGPGHPGPELAHPVHAKRPSQLCGSTGWQPAHQPLCLQLTCWAFPGCPGSFPGTGAVVGPLCPSKPLLLCTGWGHGVHCALALCFLPPVVSVFFLTTGNKRECHQHTLYCLFPRYASHGAVPLLSLHTSVHSCLAGRHQPRVGGLSAAT